LLRRGPRIHNDVDMTLSSAGDDFLRLTAILAAIVITAFVVWLVRRRRRRR
jgi:hypothetical protein